MWWEAPTALIERACDLDRVQTLLNAAVDYRGGMLCIEGPAGIGKSALLSAACGQASLAGMTVLSARCVEFEREIPYGAARQLFGPQALEDIALLPISADERPPSEDRDGAPDVDGDEVPGWSTLYDLAVSVAAERPLLICVDGLEWADRESERFLLYVSRRIAHAPFALIVARRPAESWSARESRLDEWAPPEEAVIRPRPLSVQGIAELIRERFDAPDTEFIDAFHRATLGNPYLARELLSECRSAKAQEAAKISTYSVESIRRSVLLRVGRLSETALELIRALALLGDHATVAQLVEFAGLEYSNTLEIVDQLVRMEVLAGDQTLRFQHPCVRSAIYSDISAPRRGEEHARAAKMLAADGAPLARVVPHLMGSTPGTVPWGVDWLRRAAREAISHGVASAGATYLRRALLEIPVGEDRSALLLELGRAEAHSNTERASTVLKHALDEARSGDQRAESAVELATTLLVAERREEALEVVRSSRDDVLALPDERRRTLLADLYLAERLDSDGASLSPASAARLAATLDGDPGAEVTELIERLIGALFSGESAREAVGAARDVLASLSWSEGPSLTWAAAVLTLGWCGDHAGAQRELAKYAAGSRPDGSLVSTCLTSLVEASIALSLGSVREAERAARAATLAARKGGLHLLEPVARSLLVDATVERGGSDAASAALDAYRPEAHSGAVTCLPLIGSYARHLALQGEARRGCELLSRAGERAVRSGIVNPALGAWRSQAARLHHAMGHEAVALELAGQELAIAERFGAPRPVGVALGALGSFTAGGRGVAYLHDALAVLDSAGAVAEHARVLIELGGRLRRAGQRKKASAFLRAGFEAAESCGAESLVECAHSEMRAMGLRPRRTFGRAINLLTRSERRVAGLAARGLTNGEIASSLSVTVKTVETHLSHSYRKLKISSRRELNQVLNGTAEDNGPRALDALLEAALEPASDVGARDADPDVAGLTITAAHRLARVVAPSSNPASGVAARAIRSTPAVS